MKAGRLDRRITIQELTVSRDEYGDAEQTWSAHLTDIAAQVIPLSGREEYFGAQVNAKATHRFNVRWRSGIEPTMRILFDGKCWDIERIDEMGRRDGLAIYAFAYPERD